MLAQFFHLLEAFLITQLLLFESIKLRILLLDGNIALILLTLQPVTVLKELSIGFFTHLTFILKAFSLINSCLPFLFDLLFHLLLFEFQLFELFINDILLTHRVELLLLNLELMVEHLVLSPRLFTLLFPPTNAVLLALDRLFLKQFKLIFRPLRMLLLLLLLHLLQHLLVCFQF